MVAGGASASDRGRELKRDASAARATRQAGGSVKRGQSETALKKQAKAWEAGSVGEARAQRKLDLLKKDGFTTLHDVLLEPGKNWNLDHLVFGPAGVFFVDAKNWRGTVTVRNGQVWRRWYAGPAQGVKNENMEREVNKVRGMASHASARLGAKFVPVICLAGAKSRHFEGVGKAGGVFIVSVDHVGPWLRESPRVLAPELVRMNVQIATKVFPPATPPEPEVEWVKGFRG
jgi:hypothetical protein